MISMGIQEVHPNELDSPRQARVPSKRRQQSTNTITVIDGKGKHFKKIEDLVK